jgi:hypothetical protein
MTPYVALQCEIIEWLYRLNEFESRKFIRLIGLCKQSTTRNPDKWVNVLFKQGLHVCVGTAWYQQIDFPKLILEQVSEDGRTILNLLGSKFHDQCVTYGLEEWITRRGSGDNRLRTAYCAQPRALVQGDILVTGERVLCSPREGGNGAVLVKLSGHTRGTWLSFPSRTAIALLPSSEDVPPGLIE